jgi:hypothetical protein
MSDFDSFRVEFETLCSHLHGENEALRTAASEAITRFRDSARPFSTCFALLDSTGVSDNAKATAGERDSYWPMQLMRRQLLY